MIILDKVTSIYSSGKGITDISFTVDKGSTVGYLGSNGAGKTTTLRTLLGFVRCDSGSATIGGLDCFRRASSIMNGVGYLPGEISFPKGMTGQNMLDYACGIRGNVDKQYMRTLIDMFQLDTSGDISKYSKGTKQKLAIILAFMHNPDVLILDEPTSGLDPIMQNVFVNLILQQKAQGKTILMSSHMFEEIERTCDKVVVIRQGSIVAQASVDELKQHQTQAYSIVSPQASIISSWGYNSTVEGDRVTLRVKNAEIDTFVKQLATVTVANFESIPQTLENIFMDSYGEAKQ